MRISQIAHFPEVRSPGLAVFPGTPGFTGKFASVFSLQPVRTLAAIRRLQGGERTCTGDVRMVFSGSAHYMCALFFCTQKKHPTAETAVATRSKPLVGGPSGPIRLQRIPSAAIAPKPAPAWACPWNSSTIRPGQSGQAQHRLRAKTARTRPSSAKATEARNSSAGPQCGLNDERRHAADAERPRQ
jgi:hypothetical protein